MELITIKKLSLLTLCFLTASQVTRPMELDGKKLALGTIAASALAFYAAQKATKAYYQWQAHRATQELLNVDNYRFYYIDAIKAALAAGGDVNARDKEGYTPLHYAVRYTYSLNEYRQTYIINLLIDSGAHINAAANNGETALHNAASSFHGSAMARVLFVRGARLDVQDAEGNTPLHKALSRYGLISYDGIEIIELIFSLLPKLEPESRSQQVLSLKEICLQTVKQKIQKNHWKLLPNELQDQLEILQLPRFSLTRYLLTIKNKNGKTPLEVMDNWVVYQRTVKRLLDSHNLKDLAARIKY